MYKHVSVCVFLSIHTTYTQTYIHICINIHICFPRSRAFLVSWSKAWASASCSSEPRSRRYLGAHRSNQVSLKLRNSNAISSARISQRNVGAESVGAPCKDPCRAQRVDVVSSQLLSSDPGPHKAKEPAGSAKSLNSCTDILLYSILSYHAMFYCVKNTSLCLYRNTDVCRYADGYRYTCIHIYVYIYILFIYTHTAIFWPLALSLLLWALLQGPAAGRPSELAARPRSSFSAAQKQG